MLDAAAGTLPRPGGSIKHLTSTFTADEKHLAEPSPLGYPSTFFLWEIMMKPSEILQLLELHIEANDPMLIEGPPGIGKTEVVDQATTKAKRELLVTRLADLESVDLTGLPDFDRKRKTTVWYPPDFFPQPGCAPTVWFFDEWSQGLPPVQNVAGRLLNERRLGSYYKVPDNVYICGAANRAKDRAATNKVPSHVASRFTRIKMEADLPDWLKWAFATNPKTGQPNVEATEVIAFLKWRGEGAEGLLSQFDPNADVSPNPRAWVGISNLITTAKRIKLKLDPVLEEQQYAGKVGAGAATEFIGTMNAIRELGDISTYLGNPDVAIMPTKPMIMCALAHALAKRATDNTMMQIAKLADRMPDEFGVLMMMMATQRDKKLSNTRPYIKWSTDHQEALK